MKPTSFASSATDRIEAAGFCVGVTSNGFALRFSYRPGTPGLDVSLAPSGFSISMEPHSLRTSTKPKPLARFSVWLALIKIPAATAMGTRLVSMETGWMLM